MTKRHNARNELIDIVTSEKERERAEEEWQLSKYGSENLIQELYRRGVSVKDIFGRYYEMEEAGNARTMDVEDAQLTFPTGDDKDF